MRRPFWLFASAMAAGAASHAQAQTGDSYKVQAPELAAPERGSLAGSLSHTAFGPGDLGRGAFSLPSAYAAPAERGAALAEIFPTYSAEAGISEWGMGWANTLALTRWVASGTDLYASDGLSGPFGQCQKGADGHWYPVGLSKLVRIEASGSGFVAYTGDGTRWRFGLTTRIARTPGVYAWYLDEVESVTGRKTALTWTTNASGRPFLTQVDYGGAGAAYAHRVTIDYVTLAKTFTDYRSGAALVLDRRVSGVSAWTRNAQTGAWQVRWSFTPSYRLDPVGPAFYLEQVQQTFASGEKPPPVRYTYELSPDALARATLARSTKFDRVVADYGATVVLPSYSTPLDAGADGLEDLEVASDNTLLVQGADGYSYQALPPPSPTARSDCRAPPSPFNQPRTLAAMRASSDEVQVVSLSATTSTRLLLCDRAGEPLFEKTLANVWTLGPKTRLVDVNRDHQPDLIQVYANGYQVIPNTSTADGFSFGAPVSGALNLAFPFTGIWIHDFNGDGLPDIITRTSTVIVVYYGLGNFKFDPTPRTYQVLNFQGVALNPSTYAFTWLDADGDGLTDLVLSTTTSAFLFRNTGTSFVPVLVGGKTSIAASAYLPLFLDLNGSGNAEVLFILGGAGYSVPLSSSGTGLLQTADDGKGTVLRFSYQRADPSPKIGRRPAVLSGLTIESTGYDTVSHAFSYGPADVHTAGKFLLGFQRVTRTDPLLTHTVDFRNEDRFAGVVLGSTKRDALVPGMERFETREYDLDFFQGIAWQRPRVETSGWRGTVAGSAPPVTETTRHLAWDPIRRFCPTSIEKATAAGTLTTVKTYVDRAAFGLALTCLADSVAEAGRHTDTRFDFDHATVLTLNEKGLPEKVESVSGTERLVVQTVGYTADWRVQTISSPGKGTSTFDWPAGAHLLGKVTFPDGSTVEAVERDPLTSEIRTLRTTHGTLSFDRFFRFDGQERLQKAWDNLGAATEANPNLLVRTYQYATATVPGSISASNLVEASGSARDGEEVFTAAGEPVTSAARIPEGWTFASLVTRSRVRGETKVLARPTVAAAVDPAAMDLATLLSGTSEVERKVVGPFAVVTDHAQKFHVDVERRVAESFGLDATSLLVKNARENDTYDRSWSLDAAGKVVVYTDEARTSYGYAYDALGRLREVTLPDGTRHRARYDAHGRIFRVERDDVASVEYGFDAVTGLVREKRVYAPGGTVPQRSVSFAYDAKGRVQTETHTDASGATKRFTFFRDGATPAAPGDVTTVGFLTGVSGPGFSKTLSYYADGALRERIVTVAGWRTVDTTFTYTESREVKQRTTRLLDGAGAPLSTTSEVMTFDAYGRVASTARGGATFSTLGYDGNGQLTTATFPGASLTLTLDGLTREVTGATLSAGTATTSTTQRINGRGLVDFETFAAGPATQTRNYTYKPQRFLSGATGFAYDFDASGLPTSITNGAATRTIVRSGNKLYAGTATYTFDALGRTTLRTDSAAPATDLTLVYGPDDQLATATRGTATWTFVHDEAGQRIAKLLAGTAVAVYVDEGYVDGSGLTEPVKVGGRMVGLWKAGAFTPLPTDLRGTVMAEGGALRLASPFGRRDVHPSVAKVIDYVEKGFDADLGLVRMGVRDYDPEINRFTTPDPLLLEKPAACVAVAVDCNLYGYARNAPTLFVDPDGEIPVPLSTDRLAEIATTNGIGAGATGIQRNRAIGRAMQTWVLNAFDHRENFRVFPSAERARLTGGARKGVQPDGVGPIAVLKEFTLWEAVREFFRPSYPDSLFMEMKAVRGTVTLDDNKLQILGMLDALKTQTKAGKTGEVPPQLLFVTTGNTKIGDDVVAKATALGIAVYHSTVMEETDSPRSNPTLSVGPATLLNPTVFPAGSTNVPKSVAFPTGTGPLTGGFGWFPSPLDPDPAELVP